MAETFNINDKELVKLSDTLERLHKSSLPVAVRSTINDLAFDSKQKELMPAFDKEFTIRKKTFIKSHTTVNKSMNTFDIDKMKSEMGVIKGKSTAGDLLKVQELGGIISNRENIPTPQARTSKSAKKLVSKRNYLNRVKPKNKKPITKPSNLIKAAHHYGKGAHLLYGNTLIKIMSITKKGFVKYTKLYSVEENRSVKISKSPFISVAAKKSSKKTNEFYAKNAKKQIEKRK